MMPSLKELRRWAEGSSCDRNWAWQSATVDERDAVLRFIRKQAIKGTADYEHKLMKLADAIERGEHEC